MFSSSTGDTARRILHTHALAIVLASAGFTVACTVEASAPRAAGDATSAALTVTDGSVFEITGPAGGPFPEGTRGYTLRNAGSRLVTWTARASHEWLRFSTPSGRLAAGEEEELLVSLDQAAAALLPVGSHPADIAIEDASGAAGTVHLAFRLDVVPAVDGAGALELDPPGGYVVNGTVGGPFAPLDLAFTLTNAGAQPVRWRADATQGWALLPPLTAGILAPGASTPLALSLDAGALAAFPNGTHTAHLVAGDPGDPSTRVAVPITVVAADPPPPGPGRVAAGLQALWEFGEGGGALVRDTSGVEPALDLTVQNPANTTWLAGALALDTPTLVASTGPATKLVDAFQGSGELTIEAWLRPRDISQDGPARIVTISDGAYLRNVTLGQGMWGAHPRDTFNVRLRTTATDLDGMPLVTTDAGSAQPGLQHLVYAREVTGRVRFHVDGALVKVGQVGGDLSNWDAGYRFALGNELGAPRPWLGDLHLVALYDRALELDEVAQNFAAGTGDPIVGQLSVTPGSPYQPSGLAGGTSFTPPSATYTLSNTGGEPITFSASVTQSWLALAPVESGALAPGASLALEVQLDQAAAGALPAGSHQAMLSFVNDTNGLGNTSRPVILTAHGSPPPGGGGPGTRPGPGNTGPTDPGALTTVGAMTVTQDGAVIQDVRITGTLTIRANDVTVRNFIVDAGGSAYGIRCTDGNQGIVIEDGEVKNVTSSCLYGGGFTARRLNVHESGGDGIKATGDVLFETSWIHHLGTNVGAHADGDQTRYGSNFVFRGNFFDMPITVPAPYKSNACLIVQTGAGPVDNFVVEDNWLNGGNFTVYFTDKEVGFGDPTNCFLLRNRFGRDYRFGVLRTTGYVHIEGNVWDDTGGLMDINNH